MLTSFFLPFIQEYLFMQLLDDRSAEALIGGCRFRAPIRRRFIPNLTVTNVITVAPQVAAPVAITIFGGNSSAFVNQFANLGVTLV